jgi:phosphoglycerate dehydrogenase-like enzyme
MNIVFHDTNAGSFAEGFAALLDAPHRIDILPDPMTTDAERARYTAADIILGVRFDAALPLPPNLRLYQVVGAGHDQIVQSSLPPAATLCNVYEHEHAIAEYVMAALLLCTVDLPQADADLRRGRWTLWAGLDDNAHGELRGQTIGLLGYGHIGREVATRARAFGLRIHVCNRGPIDPAGVDQAWRLDGLNDFMASADFVLASLPFTPDTVGLVGAAALAAMQPHAVILNVGRGGVIDEAALFAALSERRIGGAVIDTWYRYPAAAGGISDPGSLPFHHLDNIVMTPHMSGWTRGTIARRQQTMADNINRLARGAALRNVVRPGRTA